VPGSMLTVPPWTGTRMRPSVKPGSEADIAGDAHPLAVIAKAIAPPTNPRRRSLNRCDLFMPTPCPPMMKRT
jgi:hypothetical protein